MDGRSTPRRAGHDDTPTTRAITPAWLPDWNRRYTNRVQGKWAPYLPPWAMVLHIGRRSGKHYETPVMALRRGNTVAIALPYGSQTDWVRNVFAAGECRMTRRGKIIDLTRPRIVTGSTDEDLPRTMRLISGRVGVLVLDACAPPN